MREKTYFSKKPVEFESKRIGADTLLLFFRQNIEECETENGKQYSAEEYILSVPYSDNLENRIKQNFDAWIAKAIREDYEQAAAKVRKERNKLLEESDKEMCLDRLGVEAPSGSSFSDWLSFLRGISRSMSGEMAIYRQELRDITKQKGFPYDVKFPKKPK